MPDPREIKLLRLLLPVGTVIKLTELLEQTGIGSDELPVFIDGLQQCGFIFRHTEQTIGIIKEPESLVPIW